MRHTDFLFLIPSKGRPSRCAKTVAHLIGVGVPSKRIVVGVEPREKAQYSEELGVGRGISVCVLKRNDKGICYARQSLLEYARRHGAPKFVIFCNDNIKLQKGNPLNLLDPLRRDKKAISCCGFSRIQTAWTKGKRLEKIKLKEGRLVAFPRHVYSNLDFDKSALLCEDIVYFIDALMKFKGNLYTHRNVVFDTSRHQKGGNVKYVEDSGESFGDIVNKTAKKMEKKYRGKGILPVTKKKRDGLWTTSFKGFRQFRDRILCVKK